jgi:hypothetical protein
VPVHPVHPDPEELAAWQAGDLPEPGGARVEAHVAGCSDCAGMVAAVERGRAALAGLAEVEPPAGLHERLAAAIEREAGTPTTAPAGAGDGDGLREPDRRPAAAADGNDRKPPAPVAEPIPLDGRRRARRSPAGRRLVAVLSAAAVVVLLVAGLVPLLRHVGGQQTATQSAGGGAAASGAAAAPAPLPVFFAPDGYSGSALRSAVASDPAIRSAYQRAARGESGQPTSVSPYQSQPVAPGQGSQGRSGATAKGNPGGSGGSADSNANLQPPPGLQQDVCVARARNRAGNQELRPAFFVDTVYRGRPATILITVRPSAPDRADLWAFPRGDCSTQPFAHERVTVTPP